MDTNHHHNESTFVANTTTFPRRRSSSQLEKQQIDYITNQLGLVASSQESLPLGPSTAGYHPIKKQVSKSDTLLIHYGWRFVIKLLIACVVLSFVIAFINRLQMLKVRSVDSDEIATTTTNDELMINSNNIKDTKQIRTGLDSRRTLEESDEEFKKWEVSFPSQPHAKDENKAIAMDNDKMELLPLRASDLFAWQRFHDELGGRYWRSCNSYNNPCNQGNRCKRKVGCETEDGKELRIVSIILRNNRLSGFVPGFDLARLDRLRILDLSNNPFVSSSNANVLRPASPCFGLTRCLNGDSLTCKFDHTEMKQANLPICSSTGRGIANNDLIIWQDLFTSTAGSSWTSCADFYWDPCACQESIHYVSCEWMGSELRITSVQLSNNNLIGMLPDHGLQAWSKLRSINLSNNNGLTGCIAIEQCKPGELAQCTWDVLHVEMCQGDIIDDENIPIPITIDAIPLDPIDLSVWGAIYDKLNGSNWNYCRTSRSNPCVYSRCVTCEFSRFTKKRHIVEIRLMDNRMNGEFPIRELELLNSTLRTLDAYTTDVTDIQRRNVLVNPDGEGCIILFLGVEWNLTNSGLIECIRERPVIESAGRLLSTPKDDDYDSSNPEIERLHRLENSRDLLTGERDGSGERFVLTDEEKQTKKLALRATRLAELDLTKPTKYIHESDLKAFQEFYLALHGEAWIYCRDTHDDPCGACQDEGESIKIACVEDEFNLRIATIVLRDNHLHGYIDVDALNNLPRLTIFDISNSVFATKQTQNRILISKADDENDIIIQCIGINICRQSTPDRYCSFANVPGLHPCP